MANPKLHQKIVLALDAKDGMVATRGWTETSGRSAVDVAKQVSDWPLAAILYTDVGFALTIATGPSDGTYIQIARDIQKVAQNDGINLEVRATQGSFENMVLLGDMKVDLAIAQIDALEFFAKVMKPQGIDVFGTIRVILNLYPEEIHVLTNSCKR